jgi:membrane-bound serine protease (ClpP class)
MREWKHIIFALVAAGLFTAALASPVRADAPAAARGDQGVAQAVPAHGPGERFVDIVGSTPARAVLIVVFLMSLYIGLHAPGHGAAEAVALASLGLLVGVPLLTGYAQWWEILAVMLGLVLLAFEIFVIPGFGFAGVAGVVLLLGGLVLTFVRQPTLSSLLHDPEARHGLRTGIFTVVGGVAVTAVLASFVRRFLPKVPVFNRLILATPAGPSRPVAPGVDPHDVWPFAGTVGVAVTGLKPGGSAEFPYADDRKATAVVSDGEFVEAGTKVAVIQARGNRVVVRPLGKSA